MSINRSAVIQLTINRRRFGSLAIGAVVVLGLSSCGKLAEVAFEEGLEEIVEHDSGEEIEIDFSDDGFTFSDEEGELSIDFDGDENGNILSGTNADGDEFALSGSTELPAAWPQDIPAPPGSVIGSTVWSEAGRSHVSMIMLVPNAVAMHDAYVAQLQSVGFTMGTESVHTTGGLETKFTELSSAEWSVSLMASNEGDGQIVVGLQQLNS